MLLLLHIDLQRSKFEIASGNLENLEVFLRVNLPFGRTFWSINRLE